MTKKSDKNRWFKPVRGSYLPNNWKGWLSYIPFTAYLVFTLAASWHSSHGTISGTILFIAPSWVAAAVVMTWVAKRTS